jgi:hypothetical protein
VALPPLIDGLQLGVRGDVGTWKDLSASVAASVSSDAVARWDDLRGYSGAGIYLVQGTSGKRPTLQTGQINGLRTYYAWLKIPSTGVYDVVCGDDSSLEWRMDTHKQRLVQSFIADIGFGSGTVSDNTWFQVNASWDGSNGVFRLNQAADGSVSLSNVGYAPILGVGTNFHTSGFPSYTPAYTNYYVTDMACLLVYYGVHDTTQRQSVEAWGAGEFGI